jgi:hypothetical protein
LPSFPNKALAELFLFRGLYPLVLSDSAPVSLMALLRQKPPPTC